MTLRLKLCCAFAALFGPLLYAWMHRERDIDVSSHAFKSEQKHALQLVTPTSSEIQNWTIGKKHR